MNKIKAYFQWRKFNSFVKFLAYKERLVMEKL